MRPYNAPAQPRGIGVFSILFGLLGLAMCWWTPAGLVLSLAGLTLGFIGCAMSRRGRWASSAAGLILSAAALTVCGRYGREVLDHVRLLSIQPSVVNCPPLPN